MTTESAPTPLPDSAEEAHPSPVLPAPMPTMAMPYASKRWLRVVALLALSGIGLAVLTWQKLAAMQEQVALQSAQAVAQANDANATAKHTQELALDAVSKLALMQTKLQEVALQRSQLDELMQSLSRSRDENLVVDIESAVRLAQQQAQLTGSVEPLLAALKSADVRIARAAQLRLTPLQRAIARDIARIKTTAVTDTGALLVQFDALVALADELPLSNAVGMNQEPAQEAAAPVQSAAPLWVQWWAAVRTQLHQLLRIRRIEEPQAALLSPQQAFFLRENLKLKLLNARLALLSRQIKASRADLGVAANAISRWFDTSARKTQTALDLLQQVQNQMKSLDIPRVDDTLAALSTAAAGR